MFEDRFVTEVRGISDDARLLREMLVGGKLIEGESGNPAVCWNILGPRIRR